MHSTGALSPRPAPPAVSEPAAVRRGPEAEPGAAAADPAPPREAALLDLLTPEERAVYDRITADGALTYRADGRPSLRPPVRTGQRIDLKG